jgi:hypothetical protein
MPKWLSRSKAERELTAEVFLQGGFGNQLFQLMSILENYPSSNVSLNTQVLRPRLNSECIPEIINLSLPNKVTVKFGSRKILVKILNISFIIRPLILRYLNQRDLHKGSLVQKFTPIVLRVLVSIQFFRIVSLDIEGRSISKSRQNIVLGYFQNYRSFDQLGVNRITSILRNTKISKNSASTPTIEKTGVVLGVHIRQGDYAGNPDFGILDREYYANALARVERQVKLDQVWIFAEENSIDTTLISLFSEKYLVSIISDREIPSEIATLQKMGECDAFIMANSTFSWWGATLICNQDNVFVPTPWFKSNPEFEPAISPDWIQVRSSFNAN